MKQPTPQMEQRFSDWQRGLTLTDKRKQSAAEVAQRQRQLIEAVKGGSQSFVEDLRSELELSDQANIEAPPLPRAIDPSELRDPPLQLERDLVTAWADKLNPRDASQPLLWTRCHLQWIADGQFGERLDEAFLGTLGSGIEEKTTEAAARNLLRRLGGLPHVRGKVSVLNDCPLSRAWWRGRIAALATEHCQGAFDVETAHRVLHSSNDAWLRLVGDSVRRITVVNHASVRAALINEYRTASRDSGGVPPKEMQTGVRLLARHGPAVIFDALDWSELCDITSEAIKQARAGAQDSGPDDDNELAVQNVESKPPPSHPASLTERVMRSLRL